MVFVCFRRLHSCWHLRPSSVYMPCSRTFPMSILSVEPGGTKHIPVGNFLARGSWKIKWGCSPETLRSAAHGSPHVVSAQSSSAPPAVLHPDPAPPARPPAFLTT